MTKCCKNITVNVSRETSVLLLFSKLTAVNSTIGCKKIHGLIDISILILYAFINDFFKNKNKFYWKIIINNKVNKHD